MNGILQLGKAFLKSPGEYLTKLDTSVSLVTFALSIIRKQPIVSRWAFEDKMRIEWVYLPLEVASCCLKTALLTTKIFTQIDQNESDHTKARNKKILSILVLAAFSLLPYTLFAFTRKVSAPVTNLLQTTFSSLNIEPTLKGRLSISWEAPAIHQIKEWLSLNQLFLSGSLMAFSKKDSTINKVWLLGEGMLRILKLDSLYTTPWIRLKHQLPDSTIDILIPGTGPEKDALRSSKLFPLVRNYYVEAGCIDKEIARYDLANLMQSVLPNDNWLISHFHELSTSCQESIVSTITPLMRTLITKAINIEEAVQRQLLLPPRILTCLKCPAIILAPLRLLEKEEQ